LATFATKRARVLEGVGARLAARASRVCGRNQLGNVVKAHGNRANRDVMSASERAPSGPDGRAATLLAQYERAGYRRIEPPILQPAEPFLDLSGEDIRRRMYLTEVSGREFCLRPDLTIPVSRDYLASWFAGEAASLCYLGPVFRHQEAGPGELLQAGIESFGRRDTAAADAEILVLGLEATAHYGLRSPEIRMGDVGLFMALVEALDLAPAWKRRLLKDYNRAANLEHDLDRLGLCGDPRPGDYQGLLAALAGSDLKAAHALVTDLLSIAGLTTVGGRSVNEIADRFLEQAALGVGARLPKDAKQVIERFLRIAGDPDAALAEIRALAQNAGIALDAALDLFESRTGFLAAHDLDVGRISFSTAFGRGVDYYTGFVFELHAGTAPLALVAGGRYDELLTRLGAPEPIPAVGFAVFIDRLRALGGAP
jgi:ATP phosphoribosyltransferase regulatory subunit